MKIKRIKKIFQAGLPDLGDLSLLFRGFLLVAIFATFIYLFKYTSSQVYADGPANTKVVDSSALTGFLRGLESTANGSVAVSKNGGVTGSNLALSIGGAPYDDNSSGASADTGGNNQGSLQEINYGATGMIINSTSQIYQTQIASPSYEIQHYANIATGKTYAAANSNPTGGTDVLAPMLIFSNTMRNLAYGLIVILLVVSSFSILLGYLTGAEQKVTLVQIMINTFVTLVLITFFYEISAIIYDLTVNYGNMLVASVMEPFINAKIILERLGPGGDLNVTAALNVFEFSGLSSAVNTVVANVMMGAKPAITQSLYGVNNAMFTGFGPVGSAVAWTNSFATGAVGIGINTIVSGLLGSQALFDAVIAWVIFFINVKIFGNLLYGFIAFNMYVGFGPLLMLQSVNQGFGKIKEAFKTLFMFGLIFPVTFLFMLLGAVAMNLYIKQGYSGDAATGNNSDRDKTVLCVFQTNDPVQAEKSLTSHVGVKSANDSPLSFRRENTEYQDIYDTTPAGNKYEPNRSCRSALFPLPFTFFPAPLGNYGNRLVQVQTTDILVRTALAFMFLMLASRTPNILKELMQVDEMKSLQGMGGAFKAGLQPVLAIGGVGLGIATQLTAKGVSMGINKTPLPIAKLTAPITKWQGDRFRAKQKRMRDNPNWIDRNVTSIGEFRGGLQIQDNFYKGQMRAEKLRESSQRDVMENPMLKDWYFKPGTSEIAKITDMNDPRISGGEWQKINMIGPDGKKNVEGPVGHAQMDAAYALGRQYADPVIGASMQNWIQAQTLASTVTNTFASSLQEAVKAISDFSGKIGDLSRHMLAENFE